MAAVCSARAPGVNPRCQSAMTIRGRDREFTQTRRDLTATRKCATLRVGKIASEGTEDTMAENPKRVDLRVGNFACSIQGFKNPVKPLGEVLSTLQSALAETPELAGAGIAIDAGEIEALAGKIAAGNGVAADDVEVTTGLIIVCRTAEGADGITGETANESADESADESPDESTGVPLDAEAAEPAPEENAERATGSLGILDIGDTAVDAALDAASEALEGIDSDAGEPDAGDEKVVTFPQASDPHSVNTPSSARDEAHIHDNAESAALRSGDPYVRELVERVERINAGAGQADARSSNGDDFAELRQHAGPDAAREDAEQAAVPAPVMPALESIFAAPEATEESEVAEVAEENIFAAPEAAVETAVAETPDDQVVALAEDQDADAGTAGGPAIDESSDDDTPDEAAPEMPEPAVENEDRPDADINIFTAPDATPETAPETAPETTPDEQETAPEPDKPDTNIFATPDGQDSEPEAGAPGDDDLKARFDSLVERYRGMEYDLDPAPDSATPESIEPPGTGTAYAMESDAGTGIDTGIEHGTGNDDSPSGETVAGETVTAPAEGRAPDDASLARLVQASGAESSAELLACAAAWLHLVGGRKSFARREVIEVFDRIEGEHDRSPEARIRAFGSLVRSGNIVKVGDGEFALGDDLSQTLASVIA